MTDCAGIKQTEKRTLLIRIGLILLCAAVLIGLVYLAFGQAAPVLLLVCLIVVIILTVLRGPVCRMLHSIGQRILTWLRRADLPSDAQSDIPRCRMTCHEP